MGRDKAKLKLGGRNLLSQIRLVARSTGLPVRVIRRDLVPHCGPLSGVFTALKTTGAEAVLFLACDMPLIDTTLLRHVIRMYRLRRRPLFIASAGPGFPFVARASEVELVESQLLGSDHSLRALCKRLKARVLRVRPAWQAQLRNANTPREWIELQRAWKAVRSEQRIGPRTGTA